MIIWRGRSISILRRKQWWWRRTYVEARVQRIRQRRRAYADLLKASNSRHHRPFNKGAQQVLCIWYTRLLERDSTTRRVLDHAGLQDARQQRRSCGVPVDIEQELWDGEVRGDLGDRAARRDDVGGSGRRHDDGRGQRQADK